MNNFDLQKRNYNLQETNYDNSEFVYSWDKDEPLIVPGVMVCQNCSVRVKPYGPRCSDKKCSNCGYSVKKNGFPIMKYGGPVNGGIDKRFASNQAGDESERREHMVVKATGGSLSCWLCFVVIAMYIAQHRNELNLGLNSITLCLICCPQMYITYAIVAFFIK